MDFSFTEEQQAVSDLAKQILEAEVTPDRLKELSAGTERFDRRTWGELAKANLLGLSLPEDAGGSGLGFVETCLVLEQVGRTVALVPVLASIVMGALPIAEFGSSAQRARWVPAAATGDVVLTAALVEVGTSFEQPTTAARRAPDGAGWVLDGVKVCVPYGGVADAILVPASTGPDGSTGVFIVDPKAPGVTLEALDTTSGQPESRLELSGVTVGASDALGDPAGGAAIVEWIGERAMTASCVITVGVCAEALRLTAEYTKTREQFDKPIASFQAVGQRAADAYIDTEAVRLTAWQAAWRLAEGRPSAEQVAIAKFWAADGGQRVVHAAQHLHGGIGVDRDYPLHRYFLWAKQLELTLGGSTAQLLRLGGMMASEPAPA
ncbi:MAG TPA: acyl-CoA dehydrogenase family protein [Acidimicrobiales bacterium]|nr:acyl-CoA dehydrogenase family protein [Acidimicrobiales bacterium]